MANRYQNVNAQLKSNYNLDVISAKKNIKSMKDHIYSLIQSTEQKEMDKKEESKLPKIKRERYKTTESRKIASLSSSKQILSLQKYGENTYDLQGQKVKTPRVFMLRSQRKKEEVDQEYKNNYRKMQEYFNKMKIKTSNKRLRQQFKMGYDLLNSATNIKDQQLHKFDLDTLLKIENNLKIMEIKKQKRCQTTIDVDRQQQGKQVIYGQECKSQILPLVRTQKTEEIKYTDLLSLIRRKISSKFHALKRKNLREYNFRQQNERMVIRNGQDQYMKNLKSFSEGKEIMRVENELLKKRKNSPRQPRKMNFNIIKREQEINKSIRNVFISSNQNANGENNTQKIANVIQGLVVVMDVKNNKSIKNNIISSKKMKKKTQRNKLEKEKEDPCIYSPWEFQKSQAQQQEFATNGP